MDNKPRDKAPRDSTWEEEKNRTTNPNRRQDEDEEMNKESQQRSGQRATGKPGSSESRPSDRRDDIPGGRPREDVQGGRQSSDPTRKRQTEE